MSILENYSIGDPTISVAKKKYDNGNPLGVSRHLSSEDRQRLSAIELSFKVEVIISTINPEGNIYGTEIYNYLKSKRFDLELDGYQIGIPAQNNRFDIIPQGENIMHIYVPILPEHHF